MQINMSIVEEYERLIATYKGYVDISFDPTCICSIQSLTPFYFNASFEKTFEPKKNSTLLDLLLSRSEFKQDLKLLFEDNIKSKKVSDSFRILLPCTDSLEFELTISITSEAQYLICSVRQIERQVMSSHEKENYETLLSTLKTHKNILDASPFAVIKADMEGRITFSSSYSEHIHGEYNSPSIGGHLDTYFILDHSSLFEKLTKKLITQKKGNGKLTAHALHINGNHKAVEIRYSLINEEENQSILLNYYDISEQERIKTNLCESNNKIQSILELSSMPIIELDKNGIILNSSPSICQILGIDKNKVNCKSIYSIVQKDNHASFTKFLRSIETNKDSQHNHTINIINDANVKQVIQISGKRIENTSEGHTLMLICENISERLNSELVLIEKDHALHTLVENSPFGIYAIDLQYNITFINKNATTSFKQHQNLDISLADNLKDKINPKEFEEWNKSFERVFKGESFNAVGRISNNPNKIVNNRYAPLKDAFGDIIGCIEVSHDITSIKLKEYELLEREAYLNSILNSAPNPMVVIDNNHAVTALNPEASILFSELFGISLNKKSNLDSILGSDVESPYVDVLNRACRGEVVNFFVLNQANHFKKYFDWTASPVKDYTGTIIGAKILIQDRTRTVESEQALIESELKYKQLLDVIPGGIFMTKPNGAFLYASPTVHDILGVPRHFSLENYGYKTFLPDVDKLFSSINKFANPTIKRTAATKRDGTPIWLDSVSKLVKYNNEDVILSVLFDATQTVRIEKEKEINQKLYEILVESSFDGTDVIEIKGTNENHTYELLIRNEKMKKFFNSDTESHIDLNAILTIAPEHQADGKLSKHVLKEDLEKFMDNNYFSAERLVYNIEGELKNIVTSNQLIKFGDRSFLVRNFKDVTDLRKKDVEISLRALEIEKQNTVLQKYIESNVSLENFAYVTAHDLKSPIRTIMSFAQLLKRDIWDQLSKKNQTFIKIMIESSHSMYSLVEDVLSYSKISTEKLKIEHLYVDKFIQFYTAQLQDEINANEATITHDIQVDTIYCDKIKLGQVLQNLMRNGMKFHKTNENPIVNVAVRDNGEEWKFAISDNGIGIKKEDQEQIFTIFKQLNLKQQFKGNGIGLSTCQKIVDLWGGKIWVDSEEGIGSTFFFTIPKQMEGNIEE